MSKKKNIPVIHPGFDCLLLATVLGLCALGLIMVLSSSAVMAEKFWSDKYYFFQRQAIFTMLGLLVMFVFMYFPVRFLVRLKYVWLFPHGRWKRAEPLGGSSWVLWGYSPWRRQKWGWSFIWPIFSPTSNTW
jgi:hypothetical protein